MDFCYGLWRYYDVSKYQPPPPRDHVSHPQHGRHWNLFAVLLSLSCIILTTAYHSTTAAASNSNGLTRATWGRVPLPDTRDIYYLHLQFEQKIFVKLNMTKPLCTSYWASLPRLMIRRSKLIAGNKFLKQTYSIFPVRFNARKFKFTSFFILPQYIWTPPR